MDRPTKSGVVGLVANAQGREYTDDISDLAALRFSVRLDRPGHLLEDYQTAGGGTFPLRPADLARDPELARRPGRWAYGAPRGPRRTADGRQLVAEWTASARSTVLITKCYLTDAAFLVGLTGPDEVITEIARAVPVPRRLLYLGRRGCPPAQPLLHGVTSDPDWYNTTPLLPSATTATPEVWYETPPTVGSIGSPEQPDQPAPPESWSQDRHRVVHLMCTQATPPPEAP
jgi:CRISPR system Cascade subunit CasD